MNAPAMQFRKYRAGDSEREDDFVQSVARGLAVIKAFGRGREQLTMAEIAQACQITRAGARRILLTLEDLGYVRQDGRHFNLTARILSLSKGYAPRSIWEVARPRLQQVADDLNESVSAGVLEGDDLVYVLRIQSARFMLVDLNAGARLPAHLSSMGRVLLAALPPADLETYLDRASYPRFTAYTLCDKDSVRGAIEATRQRGWCCNRLEVDEALWCVSVPLKDGCDRVLAALHVSLAANRATEAFIEDRVVPALSAAARDIRQFL